MGNISERAAGETTRAREVSGREARDLKPQLPKVADEIRRAAGETSPFGEVSEREAQDWRNLPHGGGFREGSPGLEAAIREKVAFLGKQWSSGNSKTHRVCLPR
jgi:hypothetical protein